MGKELGENGMHVACGMVMSISLKLCGAEVYVCNEGEMKCWFGRGTKPTGTNVARMERIYRKHAINTTLIFYFSATTIGWWGILWFLLLAVRLNIAPVRCNSLALPIRAIGYSGSEAGQMG